jgi:hypothetical protein
MPTLFLCGDVMTGRGVDQILAHPCPPGIQEPYVRDARDYVALAEEAKRTDLGQDRNRPATFLRAAVMSRPHPTRQRRVTLATTA